jgi:branched-subunit amino acid transport protein AzlD
MALATFSTRAAPFILFGNNKKPPKIITYLGKYLPPAIISCILVYCVKDVNFLAAPFGVREIASCSVVVGLHFWKGNSLLSIISGVVIYMIFTQIIY